MSDTKTAGSRTGSHEATTAVADAATAPMLVVDVRKKQKPGRIRDLRKGQGRLLTQVNEMVADLRKEHAIEGGVQPIVLVVRQKQRRWPRF